ncbi:putative glutamine amidotransferase [Thioflavicoccus mobilis 8321]|uniref:Putative glutamine amidotransferase n=1 Tax=Thioflavicoccus mobilis 8321 TaxID=765912 RepID=L0GZI9_9GAMM|nr:gamma-glutamyl-gamma-aminobutyrate hydrolase family protein [Thioflavicoccus mobilis]AGA92168.1 putative glutamine amidotransferase [Thioflavicoccus mobilis 8321]
MAEGARRPLIAVTGPRRGGRAPRFFVALALRLAGGRPLQVGPGRSAWPAGIRGLIVTGGHDVEPVLYAEAPEVMGRYDKERDAFESFMIDEALARDLPILGICRGAQLLNVRLGGNLFQELRSRRRRTSNQRTVLPLKTLLVEEGTQLHRLLGRERTHINSLHNQGIDRLGPGLAVSGRDLDGIVQAVEAPGHDFRLGVQWHPEFLFYSGRQRRLFRALVAAARRRAA